MYFEAKNIESHESSLLPFFITPTFLALVSASAVIILNILLIILFTRRIKNKRNYRFVICCLYSGKEVIHIFRPSAASVLGSLVSLQTEMEKETQKMNKQLKIIPDD